MPRLRDGATITHWPRGPLVMHPECESSAVDDLPSELVTDEPAGDFDPVRRARLELLDRRYCGWLPGLYAEAADEIAWTEAMLSRRPFFWPRVARPTLPASVVRRARSLRRLGAERIYIEDDVDALSALLAEDARVTVLEADHDRCEWLSEHSGKVVLLEETPEGDADLAIIHAGPPAATHAALTRALRATRPGGHIAVCVRVPWEWVLYPQTEAAGLKAVSYERAVDHWLLPSGLVVDGAGDLVVFERPETVTLPEVSEDWAEQVRAQPYLTVDLDSLDEDRVDTDSIHRLADRIAELAPHAEELRHILPGEQRDVLAWYDDTGRGLSAELNREEDHLMITLLPFDADLEYVVVCAAYGLFADEATRTRPLRTRRWHEETVFG
jgi:hypothetical protein